MSQAGIIDFIGTHPQIPTMFVANVGTAIPIANTIEILGAVVAAHSIPVETVASGNTITTDVQYSSAAVSSVGTNAGLASFNSTQFTVDSNGFVSISGGSVAESFQVDASTPPGTNPVVPNGSGVVTVTGGQVAAGTTTNVIRTNSLAANTYAIQIQRSQAVATSTVGDNGVSHFDSASFAVDANGFVTNVLGTGRFPITPYVVGPIGQAGYQTIQSALNAANAAGGGMVWVQPGLYNENLTLYDKTQVIAAVGFSDYGNTVQINGIHTPPTSGAFTFRNVYLTSATHVISSNAAGTATLDISDAAVGVTDGYLLNIPNWTGNILLWDVNSSFGTNDGCINNSGGSLILVFEAGMGAGTTHTMTLSGPIVMGGSQVACPLNTVTGSDCAIDGCQFANTVTLSNNTTGYFDTCHFTPASGAAVTMSSSAAVSITNSTLDSSNNPVISGSGAGTLTLGGNSFVSGNNISGTLTTAGASGFQPTVMTNGQLLIGKTNSGAVAGSLTSTGGTITVTPGAGTLNIDLAGGTVAVDSFSPDSGTDPVVPTAAGLVNDKGSGSITTVGSLNTITTQLTGMTNHAVLVGAGTTTLTKLAVGTNGQVLIGATTADPAFATLTSSDSSISFTTGANTLSLQVASGTGVVKTLTGNTGGAISPTAGNIGTVGTGSITIAGSGSTLTTQLTGLTNHNVLVGAGTATITNVAPSATSGVPFISQGASADPVFGTAVVAGGGTGATSFTAYAPICGGTTTTGVLQSAATGIGTSGFVLTSNGSSALPSFQAAAGGVSGPGSSTDRAIATWNGTGGTALFNNSTTNIDSTGRQTNIAQPCFLAYLSAAGTGAGGGVAIPFDTVVYDVGSNFTTGTGAKYTAPVTGKYMIATSVTVNSVALAQGVLISIIATSRSFFISTFQPAAASMSIVSISGSALIDMTAGDTVQIRYDGFTSTNTVVGTGSPYETFVSGYLVC